MKKIIYSVMLLMAGTFAFTSCSDDDENDKFPMVNKKSFETTRVGDKDTLFTTDNGRFVLERINFYQGEKEVGYTRFVPENKELKIGGEVIGTVEYQGGEVSNITANDWFEVRRISFKGHNKAYEITRTGANPMQLKGVLNVMDTAPMMVTIK